jgi:hypothetical protein
LVLDSKKDLEAAPDADERERLEKLVDNAQKELMQARVARSEPL